MKNYALGTSLVIGGGVLLIVLIACGVPRPVAVGVSIATSVVGFIMQVCTAFALRSTRQRELAESRRRHEQLLARARDLPPEEAIRLLLGGGQVVRRATRVALGQVAKHSPLFTYRNTDHGLRFCVENRHALFKDKQQNKK